MWHAIRDDLTITEQSTRILKGYSVGQNNGDKRQTWKRTREDCAIKAGEKFKWVGADISTSLKTSWKGRTQLRLIVYLM